MFKDSFSMENYLLQSKSFSSRSALTRLRISSHKLLIEVGRYNRPNKIPADRRFCIFCRDGSIEDEFHFVMKCAAFQQQRDTLELSVSGIFPQYTSMTDQLKFKFLMSCYNGDLELGNLFLPFIETISLLRQSDGLKKNKKTLILD